MRRSALCLLHGEHRTALVPSMRLPDHTSGARPLSRCQRGRGCLPATRSVSKTSCGRDSRCQFPLAKVKSGVRRGQRLAGVTQSGGGGAKFLPRCCQDPFCASWTNDVTALCLGFCTDKTRISGLTCLLRRVEGTAHGLTESVFEHAVLVSRMFFSHPHSPHFSSLT